MSYNLRSLLLTGLFGFILPFVTISSVLAVLEGAAWVPLLQSLSTAGVAGLTDILHIFGSGNVLHGIFLISGVGCMVSMLFEAYNLWLSLMPRHQARPIPPAREWGQ
jgi:hypothetical protein